MLLFSCASVYKDAHPVIVTVIIIIIVAVSFSDRLQCAKLCARSFIYLTAFNLNSNMRQSLFYVMGN